MLGDKILSHKSTTDDSRMEFFDPPGNVYDDGYLRVEHDSYYVSCGGRPLYHLSRREFLILSRLVQSAGRPVSKAQIWAYVWGDAATFNDSNFRVHIANLRRKLATFGLDIVAMVNVGYRLEMAISQGRQAEQQEVQP
jgi:DNA-binding response OmpR family regulator